MKIEISNSAGFCFGVKRAMEMAWREVIKSDGIYSLGPLIHNKQAVAKYEEKGLVVIDELSDEVIPNVKELIIRSHGVPFAVYEKAKDHGIEVIDTTCPYVKKIQNIVNDNRKLGKNIIIIGDKNHPEIIGINGWCEESAIIVKSLDEIKKIDFKQDEKYCIVAQTTLKLEVYDDIVGYIETKELDLDINNTVCAATKKRQDSARDLSKRVDIMIVIGGKHSSNTQKLAQVCSSNAATYHIETLQDLDLSKIPQDAYVGITAGASTPNWIIDEVLYALNNLQ